MQSKERMGFALGILVLSCAATLGTWSQSCYLWDWTSPSPDRKMGSRTKLEYEGMCYEITSGRPQPLDCHLLMEIRYDCSAIPEQELMDFSGGHFHPAPCGMEPDRPVGKIECTVGTRSPDGRRVEGQTGAKSFNILFEAPEVSGTVSWYIEYIFPPNRWARPIEEPGWVWTHLPGHRWMAAAEACLKVGVGELEEVPPLPALYLRCGASSGCGPNETIDPFHPQVFYMSMESQTKLGRLINKFYNRFPDKKLGFLDMSLPLGGLLDCRLRAPWKKPHSLHRIGKSVDVMSRCPVPRDENGDCPVPNVAMVWQTTPAGGYWEDLEREILDDMAEACGFVVIEEQPIHYEG